LCIDGGNVQVGETCDSYYACAEGLECAPTGSGWRCAQTCTSAAQCADEEECADVERPGVDTVRVCRDRRTARLGESCEGKPCEEGTSCIYSNGDRLCFQNCETRADCTGGYDCVPIRSGGGVCAPYRGDACADDLDCPRGQICEGGECAIYDPAEPQPVGGRCAEDEHCQSGACGMFDGVGRCGRGCDPRLGHYECPDGSGCVTDQLDNGLCVEGEDTGRGGVGDACSSGAQCSHGICIDGQCTTWCGDNNWCPAQHRCDDAAVEPGVCRYDPSADPGPGIGLGGCSCGTGPGFGLEWLLLLGLARRRRRKGAC
jgi:uncharacterized protein (TIGR03382 family)